MTLSLPLAEAKVQLCAPGPDVVVAVPPDLGAVAPSGRCEGERFRCTASTVLDCDGHRAVAACSRGCAEEGMTLDEASLNDAQAVHLLCTR